MSAEQIKPGYKRTDVGVIPEDWEISTLRNLLSVIKNGAVYIAAKNGGIPISRIETISSGEINYEKIGYAEESEQLKNYKLEAGDLLFSHINSLDHIGKVAIYNGAQPLYHGMNLLLLRASEATIPKYLYYWLNSINGRRRVAVLAKQAVSQASISTSDLRKFFIPIPKLNEQKRIAEILGDIDDLLAQLDQLITKKRDLKQATMQQLLTGQTRLPGFSGEWEVKRLGDVCRITTGKKDVNEGNPAGQYPFFTCARSHTYSDSYSFDGEAILIAGNGEVGNLNYHNGKFEAYQRTYVLQGFSTQVNYLWHQLSAFLAASLGIGTIGSSIPYIKMENLVGFEFHSPINEDEQTAIANVISDIDADVTTLEARRDKTRTLKQGMMQELLTGRIRLV